MAENVEIIIKTTPKTLISEVFQALLTELALCLCQNLMHMRENKVPEDKITEFLNNVINDVPDALRNFVVETLKEWEQKAQEIINTAAVTPQLPNPDKWTK